MQDWEKSNQEVYDEIFHSQYSDDELMHWGIKGMSWKKGAEYLRNGGKLINGVVVYARDQAQKTANAVNANPTVQNLKNPQFRAAQMNKAKSSLKTALKRGVAVTKTGATTYGKKLAALADKTAYSTGKAMAKASNSKQLAELASKVKSKLSTNKYGKKITEVADKVAKNLNSNGAKKFRKDLAYKVNKNYRSSVDSAKRLAEKKVQEEPKRMAEREGYMKAREVERESKNQVWSEESQQAVRERRDKDNKAYDELLRGSKLGKLNTLSDNDIKRGVWTTRDSKGDIDIADSAQRLVAVNEMNKAFKNNDIHPSDAHIQKALNLSKKPDGTYDYMKAYKVSVGINDVKNSLADKNIVGVQWFKEDDVAKRLANGESSADIIIDITKKYNKSNKAGSQH